MFLKRFISIAVFAAVLLFTQSLLFRDDSSGLVGEHSFLQIPSRSSASEDEESDGCCSGLRKRFRRMFRSLFRSCRCCASSDEEQPEPEVPEEPEEPIESGINIPDNMTRKDQKLVDEITKLLSVYTRFDCENNKDTPACKHLRDRIKQLKRRLRRRGAGTLTTRL
ncbi:signal peptide-containing protein [Cryptosporidium canis]|uniref:Signal peptide-containing protein n=1 Tax=Cryptosporidium canis TaxID=195482 RepID=A0ABQ8P909_9CRYT|nr:signal peptide-containing protein [Cryptosporidium canis]KAJ1612885.1 signal peptide-containing protein [Cryptosporidium canis]